MREDAIVKRPGGRATNECETLKAATITFGFSGSPARAHQACLSHSLLDSMRRNAAPRLDTWQSAFLYDTNMVAFLFKAEAKVISKSNFEKGKQR